MIPCVVCGTEECGCGSVGPRCFGCGATLDSAGVCDYCDRGMPDEYADGPIDEDD